MWDSSSDNTRGLPHAIASKVGTGQCSFVLADTYMSQDAYLSLNSSSSILPVISIFFSRFFFLIMFCSLEKSSPFPTICKCAFGYVFNNSGMALIKSTVFLYFLKTLTNKSCGLPFLYGCSKPG